MIAAIVAPATAPQVASEYVRVRIPVSIDPGIAGTYPGLRILGPAGEIPFARDLTERPEQPLENMPFRRMPSAGNASVAIVDAGDAGTLHDMLAVATRKGAFVEHVAVDASDDRRSWRNERRDAIVFRTSGASGRRSVRVGFTPTHKRWLRVRIDDSVRRFPVEAIAVGASGAPLPEPALAVLGEAAFADRDAPAGTARWSFDLAMPNARVDAVLFGGGDATFDRAVVLEASDDGTDWYPAGGGTISRFRYGSPRLEVCANSAGHRFWRVTLENGNDPSPSGLRPMLLAQPHDVVFFAQGGERYRLVDDGPNAGPAHYDLADRLAHDRWHATTIALGPAPPSERRARAEIPAGFLGVEVWRTAVFVAATLVLGVFAITTFFNAANESKSSQQ